MQGEPVFSEGAEEKADAGREHREQLGQVTQGDRDQAGCIPLAVIYPGAEDALAYGCPQGHDFQEQAVNEKKNEKPRDDLPVEIKQQIDFQIVEILHRSHA